MNNDSSTGILGPSLRAALALVFSTSLLAGCLSDSSSSSDDDDADVVDEGAPEDDGGDDQNGDDDGAGDDDDGDTGSGGDDGSGDDGNGGSDDDDGIKNDDDEEEDEQELLTELTYTNSGDALPDRLGGLAAAGDSLISRESSATVVLIDTDTGDIDRLDFSSEKSTGAQGFRDLVQGPARSHGLTRSDGVIYFASDEGYLYRSDGTVDGTYKVVDSLDQGIGDNAFYKFVEIDGKSIVFQADGPNEGDCLYRIDPETESSQEKVVRQCGVMPERLSGHANRELVMHGGRLHYVQEIGGSEPTDWNVRSIDPMIDISESGTPSFDEVWSLPFGEGFQDRDGPSYMVSTGGTLYFDGNDGDGYALFTPSGRVFSPRTEDEVARGVSALLPLGDSAFFLSHLHDDDRWPPFAAHPSPVRPGGSGGINPLSVPSEWSNTFNRQEFGNILNFSGFWPRYFDGHLLLGVTSMMLAGESPANYPQWWTLSPGGIFSPLMTNDGARIRVGSGSSPSRGIAVQTDDALYVYGYYVGESNAHLFRFDSPHGSGKPIDISDDVQFVRQLAAVGDTVFIRGRSQDRASGVSSVWRLNED